jgi:ribosomal protein S21
MPEVNVRKNNVTKAITILNKKIREDGDLKRVVDRRYFQSKGERRRMEKAASKRRVEKRMLEAQEES